jgi:hypothetical protein
MNNPQPIYFPPGVVERNGRRIRPGSVVQFKSTYEDSMTPVLGEVVGWCSDGIIVVDDQDIPNQYVINPIDCQLVDEHSLVSLTAGTYVVEFSDRPTSLIYPVGGRDVLVDGQEFPRENLREASRKLLVDLQKLNHSEAVGWVKEHLSAPILERVLVEANRYWSHELHFQVDSRACQQGVVVACVRRKFPIREMSRPVQ